MKSLLSFGFPFLLRVIIPGLVGTVTLSPLIVSIGIKVGIDLKTLLIKGLLFTALSLSIGFIVYFLDDYVYKIFEGYIWWPKFLRIYFTERLNKKISRKMKESDSTEDETKKKMLWEWLMRFPLKKGKGKTETEALLPTKLGNIICSYEDYPASRYRIRAVFYWPRLWLMLDAETRKEINNIWAEADCLIYISFVLLWASILYFGGFILHYFNIPTMIFGPTGKRLDDLTLGVLTFCPLFFLIVAIILLILCYLFYLLSLPLHVRNGNFFESLFDLYRDRIEKILTIKENRPYYSDLWEETWSYLKYKLKKCSRCGKYYPCDMVQCPYCG
jgi:hypothetical protein